MTALLVTIPFLFFLTTVFALLFEPVTELPYGIDEALTTVVEHMNIAVQIIPPLETVWNVFLIGIGVKISLLVIELVLKIITLLKP